MEVKLNINDKEYVIEIQGNETLLEVLRERFGFTGTKTACDEAECGACTVLIEGTSVLSCITLAADV
jgi:aerobic-type carbon monoxide dehydrogenase small subunit (CoxS/CutS family)